MEAISSHLRSPPSPLASHLRPWTPVRPLGPALSSLLTTKPGRPSFPPSGSMLCVVGDSWHCPYDWSPLCHFDHHNGSPDVRNLALVENEHQSAVHSVVCLKNVFHHHRWTC